MICHLGLCKALTQILLVKIHNSPILIINFVNKTFKFVMGIKNFISPKGISKQDKMRVFKTRIVIETTPIKFSIKYFTLISLSPLF